jgi:hypothetical protein
MVVRTLRNDSDVGMFWSESILALRNALIVLCSYHFDICVNHKLDELLEARFRLPAEFFLRLGRIADQQVDLGWPVVPWIKLGIFLPIEAGVRKRLF